LASPALALLNCRLATFGAVFHHHGSACDLVRKRLAEAVLQEKGAMEKGKKERTKRYAS